MPTYTLFVGGIGPKASLAEIESEFLTFGKCVCSFKVRSEYVSRLSLKTSSYSEFHSTPQASSTYRDIMPSVVVSKCYGKRTSSGHSW